MKRKYLARITEDKREQTQKEHAEGVGERCAAFCEPFGAKELGYYTGLIHDFPKYSDAAQNRLHGGSKVDHSTGGALLCLERGQLPSAFADMGHHTGLPDIGSKGDSSSEKTFCGRMNKVLSNKIPNFDAWKEEFSLPDELPPSPVDENNPLELMFFTRMLFSALVDADRLDAEAFSVGDKLRTPCLSLETLNKKFDAYADDKKWFTPTTPLNKNRSAILSQCLQQGSTAAPGLFTLTVPTGGGKTAASLAFALRHAKAHGMKRIIYVIPYINIIEQTAGILQEMFGRENVLEHHSGITYDGSDNPDAVTNRLEAATENWDMPIIVTTAVQFFESLFSYRASQCRKLHNISESVVIFDEAQMIPVSYLRPCLYAISQLVKQYKVSAVLCTATQPSVGSIFQEFLPNNSMTELCPKGTYDPDVFRRVTYRNIGKTEEKDLVYQIKDHPQVLCIVNRLDTALKLYNLLPKEDTFYLTTFMYPEHRKRVIREIRERLKNNLPCRVVSTSLIEAGVDLDFPAVFRELAGIDSVIQAAGRCNREGKRSYLDSIVTIFELEGNVSQMFEVSISAAIATLRNYTDLNDSAAIDFYFHELLDMQDLDVKKILPYMQNYPMNFRNVDKKFKLVENTRQTVYIPAGEGKGLIERVRLGEVSRRVFRKLGQYGATVDQKRYNHLLENGDIEILVGDIAVLKDIELYSEKTGLAY